MFVLVALFNYFLYLKDVCFFPYSWFFSDIKRTDAEEKLLMKDNVAGTYLVRASRSMPENYSQSMIIRWYIIASRRQTLEIFT